MIRAIAGGTILATTTIEVIQEFTHVRARRSFDAVLAAAAHAAGAEALVSAGTGFCGIAAIHHVVPDADGVRGVLVRP